MLLTAHGALYREANVNRLYLLRGEGERGLICIEGYTTLELRAKP